MGSPLLSQDLDKKAVTKNVHMIISINCKEQAKRDLYGKPQSLRGVIVANKLFGVNTIYTILSIKSCSKAKIPL